jgi:hypothetical protein
MRVRILVTLAIFLGQLFTIGSLRAAGPVPPPCLRYYTADLVDLPAAERRLIVLPVSRYGPEGRKGVEVCLQYRAAIEDELQRLVQTLENFRNGLSLVPMAFPNDEQLFAALYRITKKAPGGLPGLSTVIAEMGSTGATTAQGAAFDLYVADQIAQSAAVAGLRQEMRSGDVIRVIDVVEGPPGTSVLDGIRNENKAFFVAFDAGSFTPIGFGADGVPVYSDPRLTSLAQGFSKDIIIEQATGFANWRLNIAKGPVEAQQDAIVELLIQQFGNDFVAQRLTVQQVSDAQRLFTARASQNVRYR